MSSGIGSVLVVVIILLIATFFKKWLQNLTAFCEKAVKKNKKL
jgi:hypothetical protein